MSRITAQQVREENGKFIAYVGGEGVNIEKSFDDRFDANFWIDMMKFWVNDAESVLNSSPGLKPLREQVARAQIRRVK